MVDTAAGEVAASAGSTMMSKIRASMTSGMGAGMTAMMAAPFVGKLNGTAGSALSNAGMVGSTVAMIPGLNAFTPEIMAGTAAITLAYKGIDAIIKDIHTHTAMMAADSSANADAAQLVGGTVAVTTHNMSQFNDILAKVAGSSGPDLAKGLTVSNDQIQTFIDHINNLPKDNQLSLVMQQLKQTSDNGAAVNIAQQFAASEMAINGISQSQANSLIQLMLAASGHNAIGSTSNTPANQLEAIKRTLASLKPGTKDFNTFVGTLTDMAVNTSSWDAYKAAIDAIGSSAITAESYVSGLVQYLNSKGDSSGATNIQSLAAAGYTKTELAMMQTANALGISLDTTGGKNGMPFEARNAKDDAAIQAAIKAAMSKNAADQTAATNASNAAANGTGGTLVQTANLALLKAQIKTLTDKKKVIDAELKTQKDITSEMQRQMQYQAAQTTAAEDAKTALEQGDYIKAAQYKQQAAYNTMSFNAQTKANSLQNQSDQLQQNIADLTDQENTLTQAIQANTNATVAATQAKVAADQSKPAGTTTTTLGQLQTPFNTPSMDAAQAANKAAGGSSQMPGEVGIDPSKWNNYGTFGISAFNSRESIKEYAKNMKYKQGQFFTIDHNDMQYLFEMVKGGNVQMEGAGKIGEIWDKSTGKYVKNLPTPSAPNAAAAATSGAYLTAQSGSTTIQQIFNFGSQAGTPQALAGAAQQGAAAGSPKGSKVKPAATKVNPAKTSTK